MGAGPLCWNERRVRNSMAWMVLVLAVAIAAGCASHSPDLAVKASGAHKVLPLKNARVMIWGKNPITVGAAGVWLEKVGLAVLDQDRAQRMAEEQGLPMKDASGALRGAVGMKAHYLVIVETSSKETTYQQVPSPRAGSSEAPETVTMHDVKVHVRGVNTRTQDTDWYGSAERHKLAAKQREMEEWLVFLTWSAIAAAWETSSRFTQAELEELKHYQLQQPAIDMQTFPQGIFGP